MSVFVDIPGIGTVEARNAASEQTLQALLKAMQGMSGSGGAGGGGAGGGGGTGSLAGAAGGAGKSFNLLGAAGGALNKAFTGLGFAIGGGVSAVGKLVTGAKAAAGAAVGLGEAAVGAVDRLAKLGDSVESAADLFSGIPLIGKVFSAVASAADSVTKSYQAVSASGASFGGSLNNFAASASAAGMTMDQFANVIKSNGAGMLGFGGTTEAGAQNFARVSKQLRSTSSELYALGFNTQEINSGLANYGALLRQQGLQGKMSNAELAAGAKKYLKEMDLLAKVTGEERSAKEAQAKQLANDAKFQASMAGLDKDVRESFQSTVLGLPGPLQEFTKDILANGTATTEETGKLMAMMPQSAAMLQRLNAKMQRGEQVTLAERNALNNMMRQEGGKQLQHIKHAGAASSELAGVVGGLAATQQINVDALKEGTEEQKKAAAESDKMNQKMVEFQSKIAEVSNKFKMLLVNSGILDVLMQAFEMVVSLAEQYLVPAFNLVISAVMKVWTGFQLLLAPVLEYISEKFGSGGLGGTVEAIDSILNAVFPVLGGIVRGVILAFDGLWEGVMGLITPLKDLYTAVFGTTNQVNGFADMLIDAGSLLGGIFEFLGAILKDVIGVATNVVYWFKDVIGKSETLSKMAKWLGDTFDYVRKLMSPAGWELIKLGVKDFFISNISDLFGELNDWFSGLIDSLLAAIGTTFGGISEEEKKKRDDERAERKKAREEAAAQRKSEIKEAERKVEADAAQRKDKADKHKTELREDTRRFSQQRLTTNALTGAAQRETAAREEALRAQEKLMDYSAGPEELLKQFSAKNDGKIEAQIKKQEKDSLLSQGVQTQVAASPEIRAAAAALSRGQGVSTNAESGRRTLEAEAEQQRQQQAAAQREARTTTAAAETANKPTQENPTTLLQELNNKMARLIQLQAQTTTNTYETVVAAKGLSKDLFRSI